MLKTYPGSPALAHTGCDAGPADRLRARADAARALAARLRGDNRVRTVEIDGYTALNAYVPPKERRGLVLIDPPFEQPDEHGAHRPGLAAAHRKWPTGIYALWYPIKDARESDGFARRLARLGIARTLRADLTLPGRGEERLRGSGLIPDNPYIVFDVFFGWGYGCG
jgi:23S rRNA (adenine2030-N6)-methyltransferase